MKRIFHQTLNAIQPSDAFLDRLESEMNRALLQRKRRNIRRRAAIRYVGIAATAVIALTGALVAFQPSESPDLAKDPQPMLTEQPSTQSSPTPVIDPTAAPDIEQSASLSASLDMTQNANDSPVSASSAHLPSTLSDQLALEDIVSCTLRYSPTEFYDNICYSEQTITGETLNQWLLRLGNARFIETSESICVQGIATLTLTYADETEIVIDLAGDSCPNILYNNVLYDLRTDEERANLTSGSHCFNDILPQYFDEITFPWK